MHSHKTSNNIDQLLPIRQYKSVFYLWELQNLSRSALQIIVIKLAADKKYVWLKCCWGEWSWLLWNLYVKVSNDVVHCNTDVSQSILV